MKRQLAYDEYRDRILGGWIGKSIGGTIGARFEGRKEWIEIAPDALFPEELPPNDDLDLQLVTLKVIEDQGPDPTSEDLAEAWMAHSWYPFNEYGIFRRNHRLGIGPPASGCFGNAFWDTGMGCPIRSEIWGYVFPGAPGLAAEYAGRDGVLDHAGQATGAEQMLAAAAAMTFWDEATPAGRIEAFLSHLPAGTPIDRAVRAAFQAHRDGLTLREARERLLTLHGVPEACDARINVPFSVLALLYGGGDLLETLRCGLRCGYDTDCTMATAAALVGQQLGAQGIPPALREPIGDRLVVGIDLHREPMTLSALADDTARAGLRMARAHATGIRFPDAPEVLAFPAPPPRPALRVRYAGRPAAAPGEGVALTVSAEGPQPDPARIECDAPDGWQVEPACGTLDPDTRTATFTLRPDPGIAVLPQRNLFTFRQAGTTVEAGVAGADLWRFLGIYFDTEPAEPLPEPMQLRGWQHHFARLDRPYLPEPEPDGDALYAYWSRILGRPALIAAPEQRIDAASLPGPQGSHCVYLDRTLLCPDERDAWLIVGNTDPFRIYLNGQQAAEADEHIYWTPFNSVWPVRLRAGENRLRAKLIRTGPDFTFSLAFRRRTRPQAQCNAEDWMHDLADRNPAAPG